MVNLAARLAKMPYDQRRATLTSLPTHLAKAARAERLKLLLTNFHFIEAKISEPDLGPEALIEDYYLALDTNLSFLESEAESMGLIQGAIRLS
ncbi:MAG: WD40 repeat domain-containing protein, partial [Moorea sp. SIO4G2]|nr:WD40 repeat domain-containing protein [Moorena sp. SIO4G2]